MRGAEIAEYWTTVNRKIIVGVVVHREVKLRDLPDLLVRAGTLSAVVMLVVACASIFAWVLATQGVAAGIGGALSSLTVGSPWKCLLALNVVLLIVGMFLDAVSIYLVVLPVILPVLTAAGVDPLHFGLVMTVNLALGQVTPPVGVNLMVASAVSKVPLGRLALASLPLVFAELVALVLVSAFPALTTWLPSVMER